MSETNDPEITPSEPIRAVRCSACNLEVVPSAKGVCPKCKRFLPGNFARTKHPANPKRLDEIRNALIAEYTPNSMRLQDTISHLANALERLEGVRAGGIDHQRLVQLTQQLYGVLDEHRRASQPLSQQGEFVIRRVIVWPDAPAYAAPAAAAPAAGEAVSTEGPDATPSENSPLPSSGMADLPPSGKVLTGVWGRSAEAIEMDRILREEQKARDDFQQAQFQKQIGKLPRVPD